jgi:hypothetical protein
LNGITWFYRTQGRVPQGRATRRIAGSEKSMISRDLPSRMNADMRTVTSLDGVGVSTVATWGIYRNPKQLPAVAEECGSLKTHAFGVVRRTPSGLSGEADPHGHIGCSGVTSRRPTGSPRGIKFACGHTARFLACRQNDEASGLVPEVLHGSSDKILFATHICYRYL